jgi:hypothetical protein
LIAKTKPTTTKTKKKKKKKKKMMNMEFGDSPDKNKTSSHGANAKGFGGIPAYPHSGTGGQVASASTTLAGGQTYASPPKPKTKPKDPKGALEFDIEEEHEKVTKMENRYRQELEQLRLN